MNFGFTEEQGFLREAVRKFVDERCPMAEVRRLMKTRDAHSPELWRALAEQGTLGLLIPDEYGGAGLSWVDFVVVLEETGRTLLPSPLVSTALATMALLEAGSPAQRSRWLPRFADGRAVGTLALLEASDRQGAAGIALAAVRDGEVDVLRGEKRFVADAGAADVFVVAYRVGTALRLALVPKEAPGLRVELVPTLDETRRSGTLVLDGVRVGPEDRLVAADPEATLELLLDCGCVAVTAEGLGAAEGALAVTVRYANDRVQFGSPIGRYQGVKHRLADAWVDTESIKSLLYYAAWTIDERRAELPRYASLAKAYLADAFTRIGVDCVQLHGAVGYTIEYDIQLYLKRSKWLRPMFGDGDYHRDRLAALTLG
ncbi:MAG: acyl-CoA/acyl-ACP dehydrogenase [Deltaproteobacteria bacterium]|nr:acyl-CoA/acyl-ACP dehydrogenase [Deltaproteobacteria bacterium]